jgi:protein TonB
LILSSFEEVFYIFLAFKEIRSWKLKNQKADLRKNITVYALMGLAFMLLLSWQGLSLNLKEVETQEVYQAVQLAIEEDIPITQMMNTPPPPPPPPPAPEVIQVVEDDRD